LGSKYASDKQRIYRIIRDAVSGTDGWAWIKDVHSKDGRAAINKLQEHYDGPGAKTRRVQEAKEQLKICHYKNKVTFSFEKYVTSLKECFDMLNKDE